MGSVEHASLGDRSRFEAIRNAGRGSRRDYALDARPIARGGQAAVHGAVHKPTGVRVAFKKLTFRDRNSIARMRREIEAARLFGSHPHVMPILDASPDHDWFVMPLAGGTARTLATELADPVSLRELITAICDALREPHRRDWIHRDLKPDNILLLDGRWVVADWGLGRRPRGATTDPARTKVGGDFGTAGFAAPELAVNAHLAGPQADVYSIGQIVGWACTGHDPQPNVPLLPPSAPWRIVAKAATVHDPARRPGGVDDLLALIAAEFDPAPESVVERAARLAGSIRAGDEAALSELLALAARSDADHERFFGLVVDLPPDRVRAAVEADPVTAAEVVRSVRSWQAASKPPPGRVDQVVTWLLVVARHAGDLGEGDLLEEAADSVLQLEGTGATARVRGDVRTWLSAQAGQTASIVAMTLRRHPASCAYHAALDRDTGVDHRIRQAVRARAATSHRTAAAPVPAPHDPAAPPTTRRPWIMAAAGTGAVAVVLATTIPLIREVVGNGPGGPGSNAGVDSPLAGLPRRPTALADTPQFGDFVRPWDQYPTWTACRTGSGDNLLTGSFPARRAEPQQPTHSVYCDNGGNLTVMFAEFALPAVFSDVSQRYFTATAPENPVGAEREPPSGTHVFRWSPTRRALVWTDREAQIIGVVTTDSPASDLVEIWNRYRA